MKILGIVAEYNPFHNGHLYHLQKALEASNADTTIAVMSGNFIQRGEPALLDKFTRADIAVKNGIDLVIELPLYYSVATAEKFAFGAVKLLSECGVNNIAFGVENNDIEKLNSITDILINEPINYKDELKKQLDLGLSYPEARSNAVSKILGISNNILNKPNNILAIEYLKALKAIKSNITPILLDRVDSGYYDTDSNTNILSATGIREKLKNNEDVDVYLPSNTLENMYSPVFLEDFEENIIYALRKMSLEDLRELPDVTEGLENRIFYAIQNSKSLEELINNIKTKRYPLTRIKRILISALLDMSRTNLNTFDKSGGPQYIRVLAFNQKGQELLSTITSTTSIPVVTSVNKFFENSNEIQEEMLLSDILATNIYTMATEDKIMNLDYSRRLKNV